MPTHKLCFFLQYPPSLVLFFIVSTNFARFTHFFIPFYATHTIKNLQKTTKKSEPPPALLALYFYVFYYQ